MSDSEQKNFVDIKMDEANLYREEVFTDGRVGAIRRLTPIKADGSADKGRDILFMGNTQLISPAGQPVPIQCPIEASTLAEAVSGFTGAVNLALEKIMRDAMERQGKQESSIITPGA